MPYFATMTESETSAIFRTVNMPVVSVIIAAYQAHGFIAEAVASALGQEMHDLEVVVAPDEPADYRFLEDLDPRVRVLPGIAARTGPGTARNRALTAARGAFIALLDADDLMSPTYLATLLPLAAQTGVAFGCTRITDWSGSLVREVVAKESYVGFTDFATAFASLHGLVRREGDRAWQNVLAEDVLFDLESLSLSGGQAPFASEAIYQLRQCAMSVTRSAAFQQGIGAGYDRLIDRVLSGKTGIRAVHYAEAIAVWRSWAAMNTHFKTARARGDTRDYQAFVANA